MDNFVPDIYQKSIYHIDYEKLSVDELKKHYPPEKYSIYETEKQPPGSEAQKNSSLVIILSIKPPT